VIDVLWVVPREGSSVFGEKAEGDGRGGSTAEMVLRPIDGRDVMVGDGGRVGMRLVLAEAVLSELVPVEAAPVEDVADEVVLAVAVLKEVQLAWLWVPLQQFSAECRLEVQASAGSHSPQAD
jgi:hypothetical protein